MGRPDVRCWEGEPWTSQRRLTALLLVLAAAPIGMDHGLGSQSHDADTFPPHRLARIRKDSRTMLESMICSNLRSSDRSANPLNRRVGSSVGER